MADFARPELIATPDWLAENLDRPDVRVVDVRWRPDGTAAQLHAAGHVPGAVHLDWRTSVVGRARARTCCSSPRPDRMAETMAAAGVADGTSVVLYDDTLSYIAARAWWSLRAYGFESARILDGGYPAWSEGGTPDRGGGEVAVPSRVHAPRCRSRRHVTTADVRGLLGAPDVLLRGRPRTGGVPRLRGQRPAPRPHPGRGQRAGRGDAPARARSGCETRTSSAPCCSRPTSPAAAASSATTSPAWRQPSSPTCSRCSATRTSPCTTAAGRSGATGWTSRSTVARSSASGRQRGPASARGRSPHSAGGVDGAGAPRPAHGSTSWCCARICVRRWLTATRSAERRASPSRSDQ